MVLFYTDLHEVKISASNMREAAIKAIILSYYEDLKHSKTYLQLAKQIRTDDSLENVLTMDQWKAYVFETPRIKTHVTVYGNKKNTCFELATFERVPLSKVTVYIINRRRLAIPLSNVTVKVVNGREAKLRHEKMYSYRSMEDIPSRKQGQAELVGTMETTPLLVDGDVPTQNMS
jgi:hypothetical protein